MEYSARMPDTLSWDWDIVSYSLSPGGMPPDSALIQQNLSS